MNALPVLRFGDLTIPPAKSINAAAAARSISVAAERSEIPLVYGEDRIKALILNVLPAAANSPNLLVQCLWCYAGESVNDLRLNDKALPAGSTETHYIGTQSTADASLVTAFAAQSITYTDTLAGYMYSVISMPTASFDGQLDFSARIRGRRLYDPRLDSTAGGSGAHRLATPSTWAYSDNPALAESDFLRSTVYGLGRTVDQSTVITCANVCDALIGSPSEKRRVVGVSFTQTASAVDIAEALRAYAGCFLLPGPNGIKLVADVVGSSVATYLHASGSIASLTDLERADIGNIPTVVEVAYTDTSAIPWREGVAVASVAGAGTTKPWRVSQIKLPGIKRYSQAFREATERLAKLSTNDISCTLEVFDVGIAHEQGDIVTVTHPVGISAMTLRVANAEMPSPGRWRLRLRQYSASAYSTATPAAPVYLTSGFTSNGGPPADVAGLVASGGPGAGRISWTPNNSLNYLDTELRIGTSWAAGTLLARVSGNVYPWNIASSGTYTVWARHRDVFLNESANAVSINITVDAAGVAGATADVTLIADGAVQISGNFATKTGATSAWDASFRSAQGYVGGCYAEVVTTAANTEWAFGINSATDVTNANRDTIDYAMSGTAAGVLRFYQGGGTPAQTSTYAAGDVLAIKYDGYRVEYIKNGVVLRTEFPNSALATASFFLDSSLFTPGASLRSIRFLPQTKNGAVWGTTLEGQPADSALLNSYQIIGQNLLPESDQMVRVMFAAPGETTASGVGIQVVNGAVIAGPGDLAIEAPAYQLLGSRSKLTFLRQDNRHTGTAVAESDPLGNTVAVFSPYRFTVPVKPGDRMAAALDGNGHRCYWQVAVLFFTAAGAQIGWERGSFAAPAAAVTNVLSALQRSQAIFVVPANAATAQLWVWKYNTVAGETGSYLFFGRPQLEVVAANAQNASPYSSGPVAAIGTEQVAAGSATDITLSPLTFFQIGQSGNSAHDRTETEMTRTWTNTGSRAVKVHVVGSAVNVFYGWNGSPNTVTFARVSCEYSVSGGGGAGASIVIANAPPSAVASGDAAPVSGTAQFEVLVNPGATITASIVARHANTTSGSTMQGDASLSITALKL